MITLVLSQDTLLCLKTVYSAVYIHINFIEKRKKKKKNLLLNFGRIKSCLDSKP